jgi:hypothetical protein
MMTKVERETVEKMLLEAIRGSRKDFERVSIDTVHFAVDGEDFEYPFHDYNDLNNCCGILEIGGWAAKFASYDHLAFKLWLDAFPKVFKHGIIVTSTAHQQTHVAKLLTDTGFTAVTGHNAFSKNNLTLWSKVMRPPVKLKAGPAKKIAK